MTSAQDFYVVQGDSFLHEFTWTQGGVPVSLTGLTGAAQIRVRHSSANPIVSFTVATVNAGGGVFTVGLSPNQTRALPVGHESCVYDVQFTGGAFGTITVVAGAINVSRDVTR